MTNEERIKADAELYTKDEGYQKAYIAGATAENDRVQHNEKVFEDTMQQILNVASWADDPYKSTLRRVVSTAKEQWKSGKEKEETKSEPEGCPYCGSATCTSDHK